MLRFEYSRSVRKAKQQLYISTMELLQPSEGKRTFVTTVFLRRYSSPTTLPNIWCIAPAVPPSNAPFTITPCKLSHPSTVFCSVSSSCSHSSRLEMEYPREQNPPLDDLLLTMRLFLQWSLLLPASSSLVEQGSQSTEIALWVSAPLCASSKNTRLYFASMRVEEDKAAEGEGLIACSLKQRESVQLEMLMPACPKFRVMIYFIALIISHSNNHAQLDDPALLCALSNNYDWCCDIRYIIDNKMDYPHLSPQEIYSLSHSQQLGGIEGYHIHRKYFDPLKQIEERQSLNIKKGEKSSKHTCKRGNFIDDETKLHAIIPGPGHYVHPQEKEGSKHKIKYPERSTYLDDIVKQQKKEKKPAPGQYNVVKTLKEEEDEVKKLATKKVNALDRITYLDVVQYQASQTPGVGNYNPRQRAHTEGTKSYSNIKPEDWRKKHQLLQKRQPAKTPDMGTYTPTTGDLTLFQNISKVKHNKNFLGRVERFKTSASGSGLNPAKYTVLQEWRGKDHKKVDRHGLEVISKGSVQKSVYYH